MMCTFCITKWLKPIHKKEKYNKKRRRETLKTLIIIKPSALAKKALGLIMSKIENESVTLVAVKTIDFDIHSLERKILEEKNDEKINAMENAKKIPCILVIAQGENAINIGQRLKKEFNDYIHVSLNEETAKYEINRFFEKKEIFENDLEDQNYFLTGKNHKDFLHKSVKEIAIEAIRK